MIEQSYMGDMFGIDCPSCQKEIQDPWDLMDGHVEIGTQFECPHCNKVLVVADIHGTSFLVQVYTGEP